MRIDAPIVADETEALLLMLYHLRMAAAHFEATPEKYPHSFADGEFSKSAIEAWILGMEALYPGDGDD